MYQNEFAQEFEQALGQEQEYGSSQETFEFNPEFLGELSGETYEMNGEQYELSGELNELQELELAHELLEISNEQELNMFLGKLIRGAGRAIGNFARSPIGRGIGNALKTVAKTALPIAGKALGSFVGGPIGGMIGGKLGSAASNLFELELEGLSPEDQEFETARAFVRFGHAAARRGAALQQRPGIQPRTAVRTALGQAARQHAPGLLRRGGTPPRDARGRFMAGGGRGQVQQRPGQPQRPGSRPMGGRPVGGQTGQMGGTSRGGVQPGGFNGRPGRFGGGPGIGPNFSSFNFGGSNLASGASGGTQGAPGFDDNYDDDFGADDNGQDFGANDFNDNAPQQQQATRGTWQRRGRTLIIQL